ncbi:MAG TPA: VWA domain-containing protein [Vicinamibacterales bacterium]|nr:VWA domain-containing protein [Vicinamibacterales bacterium]
MRRRRSGRVAFVLAIVGIAGLALRVESVALDAQEVFRSAVDLVTIQASVRDEKGRVIRGLTSADFEVRDNGQLQPVLELRADLQSPVTIAILVDMSGSMKVGTKIAMARQVFQSMLRQLRDNVDAVALYAFDSSLHERVGFTTDMSRLDGALADFDPFGSTSLYDAAAATARELAVRPASHRAIVILTDGVDTSSQLSATEVSGLASSIDVPVYVVATVPALDHRQMLETAERTPLASDGADLRDLATWTGGQLVFATTLSETVFAASSILDELRQQYVLAIEAANVREWRRLDVRVKNSSAKVKARSGYFGG